MMLRNQGHLLKLKYPKAFSESYLQKIYGIALTM